MSEEGAPTRAHAGDGTVEGVRTVAFAYRGEEYEIELDARRRDALTAVFAPYIRLAERQGGRA